MSLLFRPKQERSKSITAKQLVFSSAAIALGTVASMIKFADLPMGGSITLFSMLFITLIGYWYGPKIGLTTAVAYGLLQFILKPVFYNCRLSSGFWRARHIRFFQQKEKWIACRLSGRRNWKIFLCILVRYDLFWFLCSRLSYECTAIFTCI